MDLPEHWDTKTLDRPVAMMQANPESDLHIVLMLEDGRMVGEIIKVDGPVDDLEDDDVTTVVEGEVPLGDDIEDDEMELLAILGRRLREQQWN